MSTVSNTYGSIINPNALTRPSLNNGTLTS
jgi:hypothetical protein